MWAALEVSIERAVTSPRLYARSTGSAVTYWTEQPGRTEESGVEAPSPLVGSRMYRTVVLAEAAPVVVEIGDVARLRPLAPYDDTTDTQEYETTGAPLAPIVLRPGELLLLGPDVAWRYAAAADQDDDATAHRFRVTLSGPPARPSEVP